MIHIPELKIELLQHAPEPEQVITAAARLCYSGSSIDELMTISEYEDEKEKFMKILMTSGHESPVEHVSFTFGIEGCSRIFEQQLTRHRLASYSIQSGRYVKRDNPQFVTPTIIIDTPEALEVYIETLEVCAKAYVKIYDILMRKQINEWVMSKGVIASEEDHRNFASTNKRMFNKFEKIAIEAARYIYPQSLATKIVVTMNARSLINFLSHRMCKRAQEEIRTISTHMLGLIKPIAPTLAKYLGAPCMFGVCPEGKMTCGSPYERN